MHKQSQGPQSQEFSHERTAQWIFSQEFVWNRLPVSVITSNISYYIFVVAAEHIWSFYISYLYNMIIYSHILYCKYGLYNIMQIRGLISMVYCISCLHLIKTRSDAIPFQDFTNWKALRTNIILFDIRGDSRYRIFKNDRDCT